MRDSTELRTLCTFGRNRDQDQIRWVLEEFAPPDGRPSYHVNVRRWFRAKHNGEWIPTREGVTIRMFELQEVIESLQAVSRRGLSVPQPLAHRRQARSLPG